MRGLGDATSNTAKAASGASKAFQSLKRIGIAALALKAAQAIGRIGLELIQIGSDAEETQNKFNVTFAGISDAAQQTANDLAQNYGLAQTQAQRLLADTGDLLTGFGFSREGALELSTQVQQLAVDLASFTNFSGGAEGASQALTRALLGEREGVKQLGIAITEADIARLAEEKGIVGELTREQKAALTLELAMRQSANAIGDFERSQNSFANQVRIAEANIQDQKTAIGQALLPVATVAVRLFNEMSGSVEGIANNIRDFITSSRGATQIATIFGNIAGAFQVAADIGRTLFESGFDFWKGIIEDTRDAFSQFRGESGDSNIALTILAGAVQTVSSGFVIMREVIKTSVQNLANLVEAARQTGQAVGSLFRVLSRDVTFQDVRREFQEAGEAFRTFGEDAVSGFRNIIETAVGEIQTLGQRTTDQANELQRTFAQTSTEAAALVRESLLAMNAETQAAFQEQLDAAAQASAEAADDVVAKEQAVADKLKQIAQQRVDDAKEAAEQQKQIEESLQDTKQGLIDDTFRLASTLLDKFVSDDVKRARAQKALSIAQAVINTAQAVTKALTIDPTGILAAVTAAAGAIQIGTIAAQPIPQAQFGGSFAVAPGNNRDTGLLRVNSGERVDVTPARQSSGSDIPYTIVVRIADREFKAAVENVFNKQGGQIRRRGAVRVNG